MSASELRDWLALERSDIAMTVTRISAEQCEPWVRTEINFFRADRRFFSIQQKSSLFINQPEVGILAFLFFRESSSVRTLIQAKPEPGNTFITQIAPSIQATKSNYSRAHGGSETVYLKDLLSLINQPGLVVNDTLQSEHGYRFWRKLNRNISAFTTHPLIAHQHFKSVSVRSLLSMLHDDFAINTDARSVLASSRWQSLMDEGATPFSQDKSDWAMSLMKSYNANSQFGIALNLLNKSRKEGNPREIPNRALSAISHQGETQSIVDEFNHNNSIEFFGITSDSREVSNWNQPLYLQRESDKQVLLCRSSTEGLQFLLKTRSEPGLVNRVEFGTSFNESDLNTKPDSRTIHVVQEVKRVIQLSSPVIRCEQSDEGGRFFMNICEYSVFYLDKASLLKYSDADLGDRGYFWANLRTIQALCSTGGLTTNELRSAVSLLLYWL